jgi:hypothetical protein
MQHTSETFAKLLNDHDWYYAYSDDVRVYRNGTAERKEIEAIASANPTFLAMLRNAMVARKI